MIEQAALFTITEEHLNTGLRGFPIGTCATSEVRPHEGLFYMGQPVAELAKEAPEAVIYLLYYGELPNEEQLADFKSNLIRRSTISNELVKQISLLPRNGSAMSLFSIALMLAGITEGKGDYTEDCLNLIAKIPLIVAHVINHHAGWGKTPEPKPEMGYMENFAYMLNVPEKNEEDLAHIFRLFNILHYDHGGGNLSTFVGKAIASGLEDLYGSVAGAMNALAGPRHGKANQDTLAFIDEVFNEAGGDAVLKDVEEVIKKRLENKQLIFGFGHAVLRVEDPRATVFYEISAEKFPDHPYVKMAHLLRDAGPNVLGAIEKIQNPFPNVDAISGTVLSAAGFPFPQYFTVLFGLSRTVGISIQIMHERLKLRGGKGVGIYRPKYIFKKPDWS